MFPSFSTNFVSYFGQLDVSQSLQIVPDVLLALAKIQFFFGCGDFLVLESDITIVYHVDNSFDLRRSEFQQRRGTAVAILYEWREIPFGGSLCIPACL